LRRWLKSLLVHWWSRQGKVELMCARAEIGYANMLLYRRTLAAISHQRVNAVFEAKPVAARAVARLDPKKLPEDVPRQKESLFDAYVTLALAWHSLGSDHEAEKWLAESRRLDPARTDEDAKYLYVAGEVTPQTTAKLQLFQRAVEVDPRFDVAQFSRAVQLEMLWRTRATLERNVAEIVFREYEDVLKTNPGNVGAWSNLGYMRWLLGDTEQAREAFEGGRDYKEIKRETYVAELDYGLARVAAEQGDFEAAYRHYESGVSALLAQGVSHSGVGYTGEFYHYSFINQVIMDRFDRYKRAVEFNRSFWMESDGRDRSFEEVIAALKNMESTPQPGMLENREQAVKALISVFKRAAGRMTPAEKELLKAWAEKESGNQQIKALLHEGNLGWFAEELRKRCSVQQDATLFEELHKSLCDPTFARLLSKHLPAQRIRDAVYAFALDDYGSACYRYYSRSGDRSRLDESGAAYREAARRYDEYVMPHYHLYTLIESDERHIRKVIKLEPNWPDGKLAMIRKLVEQVEEKRQQAAYERQVTENKIAEKTDLEQKIQQARADHAETTRKRREAESKRKELERRRASIGGETQEAPKSSEKAPVSPLDLRTGQDAKTGPPLETEEPKQSEPAAKAAPYAAGAAGEAEEAQRKAKVDELERAADRIQSAVTESKHLVSQLDREAEFLEGKVDTEINEHLKTLLPHQWLWCEGDDGQAPIFDKKALGRKDFIDELKWEKEFSALHARALLTWTQARDQLLRAKQKIAKGTTKNAKEEKETEEAKLEVRKLLELIAEHFWPEDFDLLYTRRRLWKEANKPEEVKEHNGKIHAIIKGWLPEEPYAVLWSWVIRDEAFDLDREDVYAEVAKWPSLSGHSYKLLGDKLLEAAKSYKLLADKLREAALGFQVDFFIILFGLVLPKAVEEFKEATREEALAAYRQATKAGESGPGLRYELASSFEDLQSWDESLQLYRQSRESEAGQADPSHSPRDYCLRIGRNFLALGRTEATSEFDAIGRGELRGSPRWRRDIVSDAQTHIVSIESYRLLKSWLESEVERCLLSRDMQGWQDAQKAILFLAEEKYRDVVQESAAQPTGAGSMGMLPVVTPIALEADNTLFPTGEGWDQSHPLLQDYIPAMREAIEKKAGVRVPGVRVRGNEGDLPRDSYLILLNEVPLVLSTVERERKFCPNYGGLPNKSAAAGSTVTLVFNPLTGKKDGAWVEDSELAAISATGTEVWDHFQYMTYHLEAVLLANLSSFLGPQEVISHLEEWQADGANELQPRQDLIKQALPDLSAKLRFTQVLQGLVRESVPITDLLTILGAFQTHGATDQEVIRVIEAVRQQIKADLPGNDTSKSFLYLSPGFEKEMKKWVWDRDGRVFFAIPPEPTQQLLSAVRGAVDEKSVIVTRTAVLRPFVRRLIELEFPHVMVLSSSELRPDLRERASGTIEYEQPRENRP